MADAVRLFLVFFKLGLFCFGGGYAMIPLIQDEITKYGWITADEFYDILAVTEITPGAIAVNAATFIGERVGGIAGAAAATLGVIMPSFILVVIISKFFFRFSESKVKKSVFYCVRPAVMGMIVYAAMSVAETSVFPEGIKGLPPAVDVRSLAIFLVSGVLLVKTKINPILVLLVMAAAGAVVF